MQQINQLAWTLQATAPKRGLLTERLDTITKKTPACSHWKSEVEDSSLVTGEKKNFLIVRKPQILCNLHREFRIASIVSCRIYEYVATGQNETQAFRRVSLTLREKNGWSGEKDCITSIHPQKHKRMEKFPTQYFSSSE